MRSTTNKTVQVRLFDAEVHVDTVQHISRNVAKDVLCHLNIDLSVFPVD